jgi:uncharacterized membrane protein HdeD (DUF308 family)
MMPTKHDSEGDRILGQAAKSIHDHWMLFLGEGSVLMLLGLLAIAVPAIAGTKVTLVLGWIFLISGAAGLATTYWARHAPGFWWSLVSALIAILVGVVLIAYKSQYLYGGLLGWPLDNNGPLRLILALFFLVDGVASVMYAIEHRRQAFAQWGWIFASGVIDIVLASIIVFALPGTSEWTMGLLVGVNMIFGGCALMAMGLRARSELTGSIAISPHGA